MLTVAELTNDSTTEDFNATTVAIELSDAEISRRVMRIRASWSPEERVQRRREADKRFTDLLCTLIESNVAA